MLNSKYLFLSPPCLNNTELSCINDAINSNYIAPLGPQVDAFESIFSSITHSGNALALSSGTAAMHLAMNVLEVSTGDEVFASSLTFLGSVSPITFQGGIPVFFDSDMKSWNMDPNLLESEIKAGAIKGRLPKAVVPTDLYGQCADLDIILSICEPYGIPVVVDAAEALGASYKGRPPGKGALASIFSFNGNKIITTSGGGMLVSDDSEFIEKARYLSQQARDPFPHYEHSEIGYNYRLSNILAALGIGQLKTLEERVIRKREIFAYYQQELSDLPGIEFMPEVDYGRCSRWLSVILIHPEKFGCDRETVRLALEAENIESRPVWKPMHMQPVFSTSGPGANNGKKQYPARVVGGEVSEYLFARGLCLPSGTAMTSDDLDRIIGIVRKCHFTK